MLAATPALTVTGPPPFGSNAPSPSPSPTLIVQGPITLIPPTQPQTPKPPILHIVGDRATTVGHDQPSVVQFEFWLDETTGDARYTEIDGRGKILIDEIRRGAKVSSLNSARRRLQEEVTVDLSDDTLLRTARRLLAYQMARTGAQAQRPKETTARARDGAPAVHLSFTDERPADTYAEATVTPDESLPLEELEFDSKDSSTPAMRRTTQYRQVERVTTREAIASALEPNIPDDWDIFTVTKLTSDAIRAFRPRPIYWVGATFNGLPLVAAEHTRRLYRHGDLSKQTAYAQFEAATLTYDQSSTEPSAPTDPITLQSRYTVSSDDVQRITSIQGFIPTIPASDNDLAKLPTLTTIHLRDGDNLIIITSNEAAHSRRVGTQIMRANP